VQSPRPRNFEIPASVNAWRVLLSRNWDPAYVTQEFIVLEQKKTGSLLVRAAINGSRDLGVHERAGVPGGNNQIRITLTGTVGAALQGTPTQHNRDVDGWMDG
jgi:L-amino acid N-acyltransferase YncA